ncbi:uncharacterized protein LOC132738086 [Ruditapes philippinarum]|uniref:uncharacterized protein LOC132738086 n=1 Tax=Ruditapes philippinarum TaxID=129788 RepID=UPI00295A81AC|nr:uncharacterized protein LOC132738086 [Ruditapes philippinarum]
MFKYTLFISTFTPQTYLPCIMYCTFIPLMFIVYLFGCTAAFHCYQCSYNKLYDVDKEWNDIRCMTSPEQLGKRYIYPCNDTHGYCTFEETYNLARKDVTSFYRQCSITNRGNGCTEDATKLACVGSCRGEFCTKHEVGRRYESYFGSASSIYTINNSVFVYTIVIICSRLYYFDFM